MKRATRRGPPSCRAAMLACGLLGLFGPGGVAAQTWPGAPPPPASPAAPAPVRGVEAYASHSNLSAGFPDWREAGVRGVYQAGRHLLQGELAVMERWDVSGTYAALADTFTFDDDWHAFLAVGAGDGAHYLPRWRMDGFLHRKLLPARNLVVTAGAGYYRAPDGHVDRNLSLGATYYFANLPLVMQGEVRFTNSSPGSVDTRQHFVAATWGRQKQTTATARYGWGEEGYQSIGRDQLLTRFRSREWSLKVRHWLGSDWGVQLAGERYRNPTYRRNGVMVGLFWQVP